MNDIENFEENKYFQGKKEDFYCPFRVQLDYRKRQVCNRRSETSSLYQQKYTWFMDAWLISVCLPHGGFPRWYKHTTLLLWPRLFLITYFDRLCWQQWLIIGRSDWNQCREEWCVVNSPTQILVSWALADQGTKWKSSPDSLVSHKFLMQFTKGQGVFIVHPHHITEAKVSNWLKMLPAGIRTRFYREEKPVLFLSSRMRRSFHSEVSLRTKIV